MSKPILILFNGPPRAGKDMASNAMIKIMTGHKWTTGHAEFKAALRKLAIDLSLISAKDAHIFEYEIDKNFPNPQLPGNLSWRQWLIHISEKVIKPMFGNNVFGKLMRESLQKDYADLDYVCISDCGFKQEVQVLKDAGYKLVLVRIHRDGCDFSNDSRSYIHMRSVLNYDVYNNGTISDFEMAIENLYKAISVKANPVLKELPNV